MHIEKIKFERTGGFAGIRLTAEIKMDDLPDDQKHEILELFDEADFEELTEKSAKNMPIPDGFIYDITVIACEEEDNDDDEEEYRLITGESSLPDDLLPLIEILERITKKQMRNKD